MFCEVPMRKLLLFFYEKSYYTYEICCSKNVCYWLLTIALKKFVAILLHLFVVGRGQKSDIPREALCVRHRESSRGEGREPKGQ